MLSRIALRHNNDYEIDHYKRQLKLKTDDTFGPLHFAGFPEGGAANSDFTLRGQFSLGHVLG
jgi:hypothetical protein